MLNQTRPITASPAPTPNDARDPITEAITPPTSGPSAKDEVRLNVNNPIARAVPVASNWATKRATITAYVVDVIPASAHHNTKVRGSSDNARPRLLTIATVAPASTNSVRRCKLSDYRPAGVRIMKLVIPNAPEMTPTRTSEVPSDIA